MWVFLPRSSMDFIDFFVPAMTEAQVRKELAEEEGRRLQNGGISLNETTPVSFLVSGLELEELQ